MPGLALILGQAFSAQPAAGLDGARLRGAIDAMIGPLIHSGHETVTFIDDRFGVAVARTGPRHTGGATVGYGCGGQIVAVVDGEPLGLPAGQAREATVADRIAELYGQRGAAGLEALRGHFALVIVDRLQGRVTVVNDAFGIRPLFLMGAPADNAAGAQWAVGTSPAALLAFPGMPRAVAPAGLADYVAFGYPLGSHTLFEGMTRLPAATCLTCSPDGLVTRRYWQPVMRQERRWSEADLEAMRCAFNERVLEVAALNGPSSLAMSGGGDSRAILSALMAGAASVDTVTHAIAEASDAVIGAELARIAGARHHFYETRGEDVAPHVVDGVRMLAGTAAGIECHPLAFLPQYPSFTGAMLTGLGGNLYKGNFLTGEPDSHAKSVAELSRWLTARHNYLVYTYRDFDALFMPDWCAKLRPQPEQSVAEVVESLSADTPVARRSIVFYTLERAAKYLAKGDNYVRREIEARHPFMDRDLLLRSWRFPTDMRVRGLIPSYIITRNAPQLLDPEVTYAPGSGWPLRRYTPAAAGRLSSKFVNAAERLRERRRPRSPQIGNYRYGEWLRGPLRPLVEGVLLDPRTLARPYFRAETVRQWVGEHMAGQGRADRLSVLLSLELTLRELVDRAPGDGWDHHAVR